MTHIGYDTEMSSNISTLTMVFCGFPVIMLFMVCYQSRFPPVCHAVIRPSRKTCFSGKNGATISKIDQVRFFLRFSPKKVLN